jgi:D-glycero-D-manno-heptose 1,7-bisphosphate phosphatase
MHKAVFLDRDGVINYDYNYVHKMKDFKLRKKVTEGLKFLIKKKYYIFVVTNQSGIAKNIFSENDYLEFHKKICIFLKNKKIDLDDMIYSPYHPKGLIKKYVRNSDLRKPGNKMIRILKKNWHIKLKKSFVIGDKNSDKKMARKSKIYFEYAKDNFFQQVRNIHNKKFLN